MAQILQLVTVGYWQEPVMIGSLTYSNVQCLMKIINFLKKSVLIKTARTVLKKTGPTSRELELLFREKCFSYVMLKVHRA